MNTAQNQLPGPIVLFGSGETSTSGRIVLDSVMRNLPVSPKVVLLETPAGFELNSSQVIGRVGDFIKHRLQNYNPQIEIVPARKRHSNFSPDDPKIVTPLLKADMIFMGPGSPTYAVRQLEDSLAWYYLLARHRLGAALVLASAAVIAISARSLPVYEIYKVGEDLHWNPGLDLFGHYGLNLVFVPHWNNSEGGEELDTSRCFMGQPRFSRLIEMLPPYMTVLGIDEHTALIVDPEQGTCQVVGKGRVTLLHTGPSHPGASTDEELAGSGLKEVTYIRNGHIHQYRSREYFPLSKIGDFQKPDPTHGLPAEVWHQALAAKRQEVVSPDVPAEVMRLVEERQAARKSQDWAVADLLRERIAESGWQVLDTAEGPQLQPME